MVKSYRFSDEKGPIRFVLRDEDTKLKIRKQLSLLGVNSGKIYADLDHLSEYLKDKYK